MFGGNLGDDRKDARRRREDDEEPRAEHSDGRTANHGPHGAYDERDNQQPRSSRLCERARAPLVVEDERPRHERQPDVVHDDAGLGQEISPPRPAGETEPDRERPGPARDQHAEDDPRAGEPDVERAAAARLAGREDPVPQHDHQWRCRHHFLGAHAARATPHRCDDPGRRARPIARANRAIDRAEVEETHQRLDALDDVGDRTRLDRVDHPQQRDRGGERRRRGSNVRPHALRRQRASRDAKSSRAAATWIRRLVA